MKLEQPPVDTEWRVEQSWIVDHPATINADDLPELRSRIEHLAAPEFGTLHYRYECDERDHVKVVHAYFVGRNGHNRRFMKLRRD